MKTELCLPNGLHPDMENDIFNYGMAFTEYVAWRMYNLLESGAFRNELFVKCDVRIG